MAQAVALYERAVRLTPSSASYCLNLMHTIELHLDGEMRARAQQRQLPGCLPSHTRALDACFLQAHTPAHALASPPRNTAAAPRPPHALAHHAPHTTHHAPRTPRTTHHAGARALAPLYRFCAANPTRAVGGLTAAAFAAALPPLKELAILCFKPRAAAAAATAAADATAAAAAAAAEADDEATRAVPALPAGAGDGIEGKPGAAAAGTYGTDELDLLAAFFTAVKILWGLGALSALPPLIEMLEKVRPLP